MKKIKYTITFQSYWHCGSGLGAGAKADALVVKDDNKLPFVPGRTVKGLVREAIEMLLSVGNTAGVSQEDINECFGTEGNAEGTSLKSKAFFSNAILPSAVSKDIVENNKDAADLLYRQMASTSIDDSGVASDHTLRSVEVTVPCTLEGYVGGVPDDENLVSLICRAFSLVRRLGVGRNRGLGRCSITTSVEEQQQPKLESANGNIGNTVMFRCHLKTDIILNQKSASEGANKSLDFIPGACFLGIAASSLYSELAPADAYSLFHSGAVRYSDAHPVVAIGGKDYRTLRIPASMFYPKGSKVSDECYIHHHYNRNDAGDNPPQLKQCRAGFYAFPEGGEATEVRCETSYAIKSAYDSEQRRSEDAKMFGYESLCPGTDLCFSVEFDDSVSQELRHKVVSSLIGLRRVGRSRSAQYGQVEIELKDYEQTKSSANGTQIREVNKSGAKIPENKNAQVIYAESRLIFLDENGQPTFQPTVEQLGLPAGSTIRWDMSQVRTFQYSPWNYKRQCYDADRCGIEKGSVIVVEVNGNVANLPTIVGNFRAEGFGHVIFNPAFLDAKPGENGKASIKFAAKENAAKVSSTKSLNTSASPLLAFLEKEAVKIKDEKEIYEKVNGFVKNYGGKFQGKDFASQWGTIRNIAQTAKTAAELHDALFSRNKDDRGHMDGYLMHGVAAEKWEDKQRRELLDDFVSFYKERRQDAKAIQATINLASEMAKICRNNGKEANND